MYDPDDDEPTEGGGDADRVLPRGGRPALEQPALPGHDLRRVQNALDWLHVLGRREPPYLHDKVIGLISAAGGTQGLQAINTMEFSRPRAARLGRALRRPDPASWQVFGEDGSIRDDGREPARRLGGEVVRVTEQALPEPALHRQAECAEAAERVLAPA